MIRITSSIPFAKLVRRPNSAVFKVKKSSYCIVSMLDDNLYLNKKGEWVDSLGMAKIATFSEMYDIVKDFDNCNGLVFLFVKL